MTKAGLSADVIIAKIKSSKTKFDTSPNTITELKAANVSDGVILAMVEGPTAATKLRAHTFHGPLDLAQLRDYVPQPRC